RFAEGATKGSPTSSINRRAVGWEGIRIATVCSPPETMEGTFSLLSTTKVKGPGQNALAKREKSFGKFFVNRGIISKLETWTIRGLSEGLPLISKTLQIASSRKAKAPSPYTVSVGKMTGKPAFKLLIAFS